MFILGIGARVIEAVAIAALTAVATKAVELAADEIKERRKPTPTPEPDLPCST